MHVSSATFLGDLHVALQAAIGWLRPVVRVVPVLVAVELLLAEILELRDERRLLLLVPLVDALLSRHGHLQSPRGIPSGSRVMSG
ncbi:MAG: hypothetical protein ACYCTE_14655 [Acidimicrobiales bacterium]